MGFRESPCAILQDGSALSNTNVFAPGAFERPSPGLRVELPSTACLQEEDRVARTHDLPMTSPALQPSN
jgi:hypothetical protein